MSFQNIKKGPASIALAELFAKIVLTIISSLVIGFAIIWVITYYLGLSIYVTLAIAIAVFLFQFYISPKIIIAATKLRYAGKDEYPQLRDMVLEFSREFGVKPPKLAIAPAREPNAFVFGRTRHSASMVIHEGLLSALSTEELKAVMAHEMAHIKHGDFTVMTFASFVPMLAYIVSRDVLWASFFEDGKNAASYIVLFGMLAFMVYFISELLVLPVSYQRESYADLYCAENTGKPENLARALYKISYSNFKTKNGSKSATSARAFYIIDFFNVDKDMWELKNHYEQLKDLVPGLDIGMVIKTERQSRNGLLGMLNSMLSTHPQTYRRIMSLVKEKKKIESG
ncbi:MAG: zinc metalloprotease HtpX [Candidatus Micrarchaeaceae archaeon]